jgi:colanic acid/amylovoran biosynthesis glycosyltransferase
MHNRVIIILPSPVAKAETFIKALVLNLKNTENCTYDFIYPGYILNKNKIFSILKVPFYFSNIVRYINSSKEHTILKKVFRTYIDLDILTNSHVKVLHYLFANLAVGRENLARSIGAKTSIGLRGYDITFYALNHPNAYGKDYWSCVDFIQTNSQDLYNWAIHWGAYKSIPVTTINAAVNDYYIKKAEDIEVKENLEQINFVFVGRLHWKKGLDTLFRTFIEYLKMNSATLVIIGDGPEMEKLNFLIEKYQLKSSVQLMGRLLQSDILKIFDESDVLLAPSIQEGCSNVVLEAQSRGLYCVVSDAEGMNEVLENNVTGKICNTLDVNQWINAIEDYRGLQYDKRKKSALYSVDRIANKFTRTKQIREWNEYFKLIFSSF